jgi:NADH-quinone oxidoreductase subunit G
MVVPKAVNTLGVSLIADLDRDEQISSVVGYGAKGDFVISSLAGADMAIPAFNQQEGTIVSADNRVLPTNAAIGFDGYELNDIANALGVTAINTIDYTTMLCKDAGFNGMAFDELQNFLSPLGVDDRGYLLDEVACATNGAVDELDDMPEFNGTIIYHANPVLQFNAYTNTTIQLPRECELVGSAQFAVAAKVADGDLVEFLCAGETVQRVFKLDETLKGTVALNPTFDLGREIDGYRFEKSQIKRVVNG